ncbi:hypothetical protein N7450_000594 [Penicillium hetheringtonii]|uniref:t-SNARE coiled-coil homology domain-containing protein n=1 Tax=Penicillium hetheringtonii TaxID=911720 RepID=A0AAD6E304_9EURO|nr:hypothetical protein N7450_000594 [Penicillium hetheringtonii]
MTDLTPTLNKILSAKNAQSTKPPVNFSPADEFLKEAHRINSHITSLSKYLTSIRHAYLSTNTPSRRPQPNTPTSQPQLQNQSQSQHLTDPERDAIDSSTALLLRDLASSITNLSDAETLRKKTTTQLLHKKYGHTAAGALLLRWANGNDDNGGGKSAEQIEAEEREKTISSVREGILWFLRRGLDFVVDVQRGMVEKRIERVREKEKSVLYKAMKGGIPSGSASGSSLKEQGNSRSYNDQNGFGSSMKTPDAAVLSEADSREIEGQLSAEQLQLFAEENDSMLKHYEDTLGKVQNAERSLLEISSLQETLVTHLATQEEFISQLVSDVDMTEENVGRGNRELKRATERRSTAQAVFWELLVYVHRLWFGI